ncbi:hypothetical protein CTI12_AA439090 [Artemisia annua]|uniref:Uncharacterized protein n=1 Tax=Artemisia annua TaxID=35608 RepID=A0A2U1LYI2_ARTAN|nr:hypothetical protein CTI12_AA439090 [Artemisia annua]
MPGNDCSDLMTSFTGQNCCVNSSMTDKFLEHEPQSTSTKNMIHLAQRADELSDVQDVKTLLDSIKDHDPDKLVVQYKEDYAHADFVFAVNAKEVVYDPVMTVDVIFKIYSTNFVKEGFQTTDYKPRKLPTIVGYVVQ